MERGARVVLDAGAKESVENVSRSGGVALDDDLDAPVVGAPFR